MSAVQQERGPDPVAAAGIVLSVADGVTSLLAAACAMKYPEQEFYEAAHEFIKFLPFLKLFFEAVQTELTANNG